MINYYYVQDNILRTCLLCFTIIILFRSFLKKDIRTLIFVNQKKPCIGLELNSKVQTKQDIEKEKDNIRINQFIVDETLIKVGR
jgi:hypothetical protein